MGEFTNQPNPAQGEYKYTVGEYNLALFNV